MRRFDTDFDRLLGVITGKKAHELNEEMTKLMVQYAQPRAGARSELAARYIGAQELPEFVMPGVIEFSWRLSDEDFGQRDSLHEGRVEGRSFSYLDNYGYPTNTIGFEWDHALLAAARYCGSALLKHLREAIDFGWVSPIIDWNGEDHILDLSNRGDEFSLSIAERRIVLDGLRREAKRINPNGEQNLAARIVGFSLGDWPPGLSVDSNQAGKVSGRATDGAEAPADAEPLKEAARFCHWFMAREIKPSSETRRYWARDYLGVKGERKKQNDLFKPYAPSNWVK